MGRKYYKKNKKKRGKSKKYRLSTRVVGGYPPQARVHLKFCLEVNFNVGSDTINSFPFRANCITDPLAVAGGHNVSNAQHWFNAYRLATVTSSSMKVTSIQSGITNNAMIAGIMVVNNTTSAHSLYSAGGYAAILEQPYTSTNTLTYGTLNGSQIAPRPMKAKFNASRYFDRPYGTIINSAEFGHHENQLVETQAYYSLWGCAIAANNPGPCTFLVEIDYSVAFSQPERNDFNPLTPSLIEAEKGQPIVLTQSSAVLL